MNDVIKKKSFTVLIIMLLAMTGCSNKLPTATDTIPIPETGNDTDAYNIASVYYDLYDEAVESNTLDSLNVMKNIVNQLGRNGYAAVDDKNQVDMTSAEKVIEFCEQAEANETAEITIISVSYSGGFTKYDLKTKNGKVDVSAGCYLYDKGNLKNTSTVGYTAESWQYTDDGYLMFEGTRFFEELYVLTLSDAEEHVALRVLPLDEKFRELNRTYIRPIGYKQNNMFLLDWSEKDFSGLDFYDLYDRFYPLIDQEFDPYAADYDPGAGANYRIPKEHFEHVVKTYLNIDSQTLQSKTTFFSEDGTYEYRARGIYEVEYPEYPYSEVVNCTESSDGTIMLTVNVIYPYESISKVYAHEVTVRPLENGKFHYVSNRIIPSESNQKETWHVARLTMEEWKEYYGGAE